MKKLALVIVIPFCVSVNAVAQQQPLGEWANATWRADSNYTKARLAIEREVSSSQAPAEVLDRYRKDAPE